MAVWLEVLLADFSVWGFGWFQHSCFDNRAEAVKVMDVLLEASKLLYKKTNIFPVALKEDMF